MLLAGAGLVAVCLPAVSSAATKPPVVLSAFVPNSIGVAGTSALSISIGNPNSSGSLSGVSLTDTLPNGLVIENPSGENGTCGTSSVITANPGSTTVSLTGGSIKASTACTFSVDVTSNTAGVYQNTTGAATSTNGGTGNSDTESITVVAPPTISLGTPSNNATYDFGQRVATRFSCSEAANGPGLTQCAGNVDDSDTDLNSGAPLITSVAGAHTFTVTAISGDGQLVTDSVDYTVRPDNHFTVLHAKARPHGLITYQLELPGPGRIKVRELASRSKFGEKTAREGQAGKITLLVPAGPGAAALLASKPSTLVIRAQITFTPKGGVPRTITLHGVRVV